MVLVRSPQAARAKTADAHIRQSNTIVIPRLLIAQLYHIITRVHNRARNIHSKFIPKTPCPAVERLKMCKILEIIQNLRITVSLKKYIKI